MKRFLAVLLALAMIFTLAACGEKKAEPAPETEAAAFAVAMITDYGDITDESFNQATYEGCKEFCEANGIKFNYYKPAGDSDAERVAMIDAAVADGYNVIVTPGYAFAGALNETMTAYPDVYFIALDVSAGDFGTETLPANAFSAVYQEELCGYMAGVAAVKLGYTHLGYLGGMAVPAVVRYGYGFVQGANAAAEEIGADVTVEYAYGNQFFGDADITAAMDTWYQEKGVQVVFACGGGIYTSAAEAAAKVEGGKVIGVDVDQAPTIDAYGEGMTVTSAMKGLSATVKTLLSELCLNDNWAEYSGKIQTLGLVSGTDVEANYVQIPYESTQWADSFTQEDYAKLVADMFNGTVQVSNAIDAMPETSITVNDLGNIK